MVLSTVHHLPPLTLSGTWLHQTPWPDDTVLTTLLMTTGWSHPKGCFPGLLTLDPESAHDRVGHTLLGNSASPWGPGHILFVLPFQLLLQLGFLTSTPEG